MKIKISIILSLFLLGCNSNNKLPLGGSIGNELALFKPSQTSGRMFITTGSEHLNSILGVQKYNFLRTAEILVDGVYAGEIKANHIIVIDVSPGKHQISWVYKGYDPSTVIAKPINVVTPIGTAKFLQLEFYDDRSVGSHALKGLGIIGAVASSATASFRTEIITTSQDALSGKNIIEYKKL